MPHSVSDTTQHDARTDNKLTRDDARVLDPAEATSGAAALAALNRGATGEDGGVEYGDDVVARGVRGEEGADPPPTLLPRDLGVRGDDGVVVVAVAVCSCCNSANRAHRGHTRVLRSICLRSAATNSSHRSELASSQFATVRPPTRFFSISLG